MKCEASGCISNEKGRFFIVDIECAAEKNTIWYGDYSGFWVCDKCIKYYIEKNENNPHYIIIKEQQ